MQGEQEEEKSVEVAEEDDTGTKAQYGQGEKEEPLKNRGGKNRLCGVW